MSKRVTNNGLSKREVVHERMRRNFVGASLAILGSMSEGGDQGRRMEGIETVEIA